MFSKKEKWKGIFILGASSDMARELCLSLSQKTNLIFLAGRNGKKLEVLKKEIENFTHSSLRVECIVMDVLKLRLCLDSIAKLLTKEELELLVCFTGYLGKQEKALENEEECLRIINTNYAYLVLLLNQFARYFQQRKKGHIVGISSVAGERGRRKNYFYGSAKSAFSTYLSGLRVHLYSYNVQVSTILPGLIQTKMLGKRSLLPIIMLDSKKASRAIYLAICTKKDVAYIPRIWYLIMLIYRAIPEVLYKRIF